MILEPELGEHALTLCCLQCGAAQAVTTPGELIEAFGVSPAAAIRAAHAPISFLWRAS